MTTPDFRDELQQLVNACLGGDDLVFWDAVERATTVLATPPPEPQEVMIPDQYKGHQLHVYRSGFHAGYKHGLTQAPAALTQPAPPTDEELKALWWELFRHDYGVSSDDVRVIARAVLERWGK